MMASRTPFKVTSYGPLLFGCAISGETPGGGASAGVENSRVSKRRGWGLLRHSKGMSIKLQRI